jgi:hypothetical protein
VEKMRKYKQAKVYDSLLVKAIEGTRLDEKGNLTENVVEYDVVALLKVIADLQDRLVFEYGENYETIQYIFEQAGVSKEIFEQFDLSDLFKAK